MHLATHLHNLGLAATATLLVGDSVDDARAAKEVGARCILYASGLHTRDVLCAEGMPVVTSLRAALSVGTGANASRTVDSTVD